MKIENSCQFNWNTFAYELEKLRNSSFIFTFFSDFLFTICRIIKTDGKRFNDQKRHRSC